jgi:mono/diheme cytochrome c family protein
MKNRIIPFLLLLIVVGLSSCIRDKNNPGYAYMADYDMYFSKYDKAYAPSDVLPNGQVNQPSPEGSVARGAEYFPYNPKSIVEKVADQEKAGKELVNPVTPDNKNLAEGKRQYEIFCMDCHGADGKGNGHLYAAKLFPARPRDLTSSYVQDMPDGTIYYIITEGSVSGLMGPHGVQITPDNRWKIVNYIRTLGK